MSLFKFTPNTKTRWTIIRYSESKVMSRSNWFEVIIVCDKQTNVVELRCTRTMYGETFGSAARTFGLPNHPVSVFDFFMFWKRAFSLLLVVFVSVKSSTEIKLRLILFGWMNLAFFWCHFLTSLSKNLWNETRTK